MQENVQKIIDKLESSKVIGSEIIMKVDINGDEFNLLNKDIMGNVIQSWLEVFLNNHSIKWKSKGTQSYPDFVLDNNEYLEVKCFLHGASPAFDLANFKSFIDSLLLDPKRLDSDYLVFSYSCRDKMYLSSYFCKKIWELTSDQTHGTYKGFITSQVKGGTIYNLRPGNFVDKPENSYSSRRCFVEKIRDRIEIHAKQLIDSNSVYKSSEDWFELVEQKYQSVCEEDL